MRLAFFRSVFPGLLLLALLAIPARAEHDGKIQILLLGDSTTEGSIPRLLKPEGPHLEAVIDQLLAAEEDLPPTHTIQSGVSGEFIRRLIDSGRYEKDAKRLPGLDYIFVRYGINDRARLKNFREDFPKDFHELIAMLQEDHPEAEIIPMTVIPFSNPEVSKEIDDLVRQVAKKESLTVFDIAPRYAAELEKGPNMLNYRRYALEKVPEKFHALVKPYVHGSSVVVMDNELDGILGHLPGWFGDRHPNLAGYNVIADASAKYLAKRIRGRESDGIVTFESVPEELEDITADEPLAAEFSAGKAARYLDRSALTWQKKKKCATCHTNMGYLWSRPALSTVLADSGEVRSFYEDYPKVRWEKRKPSENQGFWPIVVGAGLTFNDLQTTGKLSDTAREALDLMWTVQREDGGWKWPDCDYAPMEIDDHYGVTVAALTVGIAPDDYAETAAAKTGLEKLRRFLANDPPKSLHHRAMLAWCSKRVDGIATREEREKTLAALLALQLPDGGWSTSSFLTDWKGLARKDGKPLDTKTSDGYGTGLVIVIARELGVPADDPRLQKGIAWIKANQRESGKWFTRSPVVEARNLISNIGSAYCVLALQSCGELPGWPLSDEKQEG